MYTTLGATAAPPLPAIFTPAGDNDFSRWATQGSISVQLSAAIAPNGRREATKLSVNGAKPFGWMAGSFTAPFADPAFIIFAKQGSGPTEANQFGLYNNTRQQPVSFVTVDYAAQNAAQLTGIASVAPADQGFVQVTAIAPAGTVAPGDEISVYPGFVGNQQPAGQFNYVWCARILDPTTLGGGFTLTRNEKFALLGIGLSLLLRR